jgi:hypothetical protein
MFGAGLLLENCPNPDRLIIDNAHTYPAENGFGGMNRERAKAG